MAKKRKLNNKFLTGSLIIITGAVLVIITIINLIRINSKGDDATLIFRSLNTESDLVKEIYSYLGSNDLQVCNGLEIYSDKTKTIEDIDEGTKICMAYSLVNKNDVTEIKLDKTKKNNTCTLTDNAKFATDDYSKDLCTLTKYDANKVKDQYKKMYGKEIDDYKSFQLDNTTICHYYEGNYYCGLSETYTYTIGAEASTYRSIKKAIKENDKIVIYDYFLRIENNECFKYYEGNTKNDKCSKKYDNKTEINYSFMKKYGTLYKHTYEKDKDGYHWVKTELEK